MKTLIERIERLEKFIKTEQTLPRSEEYSTDNLERLWDGFCQSTRARIVRDSQGDEIIQKLRFKHQSSAAQSSIVKTFKKKGTQVYKDFEDDFTGNSY